MKLKDKVAIITGGTKGIGYGIAEEYLKEGAKIIITGRNETDGKNAETELSKISTNVKYVREDVSKLDDLQNSVDKAVEIFGGLDIYVANAGINDSKKTHFLEITEESYNTIMDINLKGLFFGGQYAARQMAKQGRGGALINISSVNSYLGLDSQVVYTTSKGAITQLTKVQAIALVDTDIRVNAIAPGAIETDLMRRVGSDPDLMNTILSRIPQRRIGSPNECGRLAVYLASDDANYIFGQTIFIDGGRGFQAFPTPGYKTVKTEN